MPRGKKVPLAPHVVLKASLGHQRNAGGDPTGLGKGLKGVPLDVAEQATLTCKAPTGV
jgi:hypothetical protein